MKGLTPKQLAIITFIQNFIDENHYSPSYREIMTHFNLASPGSVYKHIRTLEKKGVLVENKKSHRSLEPSHSAPPSPVISELELPLIGNLAIGYPLEVHMNPRMIAVPRSLVQTPDNTYILQAQGDSLQNELIQDGDLLLIEVREDIQPGELILGLINQTDSILKRYYPEGQYIRLESQDKETDSLIVRSEHISIQGALVGLIRIY